MKRIQRSISFLLAMVMVISMVPPMAVNAEETEPTQFMTEATEETISEDTTPEETVSEEITAFTEVVQISDHVSADAMLANAAVNGTYGENLTWELDSSGTLTISGTGPMEDGNFKSPWPAPRDVKTVVINSGVTSIGNYAFYQCENLTEIIIPETVTEIGDMAFCYCRSLTEVNIPDSVTSIGTSAFFDCVSLPSVSIPDSVESIGNNAFYNCAAFTEIDVPKKLTEINYGVYRNCTGLTEVIIPDNITIIGQSSFAYCSNLTAITIPKSVTQIGMTAFVGCSSLKDVYYAGSQRDWDAVTIGYTNDCLLNATIHFGETEEPDYICGENLTWHLDDDGVLTISGTGAMRNYAEGESLLYDSDMVKSVIVAEGATTIGSYAFSGFRNLEEITLPKSISYIGMSAFISCSNLQDVYYSGSQEGWESVTVDDTNGWLLNATIHYGELDEPVPDDELEPDYTCGENLTWNLNESGILTISGTGAMRNYAEGESPWYGSDAVKSVIFSDGATTIGSYAFIGCRNLAEVVLPKSITAIGVAAFAESNGMQDVYYAGSQKSWEAIMVGASNDCLFNATIYFGETDEPEPDDEPKPDYACGENLTWSLIDGVLTVSGEGSMYDWNYTSFHAPWYVSASEISEIIIENGVTCIGSYAFCECISLASITIPDSVTMIGERAFAQCISLTNITIPSGVATIETNTFYGCSYLAEITIPKSITTIASNAFAYCSDLEIVYYSGTEAQWSNISFGSGNGNIQNASIQYIYGPEISASGTCGENLTWVLDDAGTLTISGEGEMEDYIEAYVGKSNAPWFSNRDKILSVVIKQGVTTIGQMAFYRCNSLVNVTIPYGVTSIGNDAFFECDNLTSVIIPSSVTDIGNSAFDRCSSLINVTIPDSVTSIGYYAFAQCSSLINITIPNSVTFIGDHAFVDCNSLISIKIPSSVTSIEYGAFAYCDNLTSIDVDAKNAYYFSDEYGVLFNKDKTELIVAPGAISGNYTVPSSVINICDRAFAECYNLTSVTIPYSVTNIDEDAFDYCVHLTKINIDTKNTYYSSDAHGVLFNKDKTLLINVPDAIAGKYTIPSSVKDIAWYAFDNCKNLTCVTISDNVTDISFHVFENCSNLTSIIIPDSVTYIAKDAFDNCNSLKDVYYGGTEEQWSQIVIQTGNDNLINATIHFNSEPSAPDNIIFSIPGLTLNTFGEDTFYLFMGDPHVYSMDSPDDPTYLKLSTTLCWDEGYGPSDITWTSSDENIFKVVSGEDPNAILPQFIGVATGTASLTATNHAGDSFSLDVNVVKPNAVEMMSVYDTKYYHSSGGFYSAASSISDSVEIFFELLNKPVEEYPCVIQEDRKGDLSTDPITLTATVSGNDLSFDRDTYQNTYTVTYDAIPLETSIFDILTLFPTDINTFCPESASYTVEITFDSESFESPLKESYSFTVYNEENLRVTEHISFIESNKTYNVFKENIYGRSMISQKYDCEYIWSKWSTFDFENYYEIVWADVLLGMLDAPQTEYSIVPAILKQWCGDYKTLLNNIDTIVSDNYEEKYEKVLDISEMKIDKLLKKSKYTNKEECMKDELYVAIVDTFGNEDNVQTLFAKFDTASQILDYINLAGDVVTDIIDWTNTISIMNAFKEADKKLQVVFRAIADKIPSNQRKMREAIEDYLNYSRDDFGSALEVYESVKKLNREVGLKAFETIVGKKLWDYAVTNVVNWIGTIAGNGGTFASTSAFATVSTVSAQAIAGATLTGVTLGLCVSDLICNSEDKAAEMGKLVAMSEYSPYVVDMLEDFERYLYIKKNNQSVALFERAFQVHQATQSYIIDHTISSLQAKAESVLYVILGNREYYETISGALVNKRAIDKLKCCGELDTDTTVTTTKVIGVKCPVDVYVYDQSGNEVVRILADSLNYAAEGLLVHIYESEKYIALPANQEYTVNIIATDEGTMDYQVLEYNDDLKISRNIQKNNIPLIQEREFTADVPNYVDSNTEDYALTFEDVTLVPDEVKKLRVYISEADLMNQSSVWIDGREYAVQTDNDDCYVDLPDGNASTMVTYTYYAGDSSDVHMQYPIGMKVWSLRSENGFYRVTRVEELDNILQYSGSSIRVTGKQGIRMITSIEKSKKDSLISEGLAGYTLKEYGTLVAWASRLDDSNPLVLEKPYSMSNYAYKKGIADPVFAYDVDLMQYTNVLVGFSLDQCKDDIAMRPYMILTDAEGNDITIYGGIVRRSIGYIAYQNRNTFTSGTEAYNYVWDIIHHVYGNEYDAEYKA